MSKRVDKLLTDVEDIKINLAENNVKMHHYNKLLDEHIQGIKNLDARVKPIEDHVQFLRKLIKLFVDIIGIVGTAASLISLF